MTSDQIYDQWFAGLDPIDQELVDKVNVTNDDDYPFVIAGQLSKEAKERGGFYKSEVGWTVMSRPFPPQEYSDALDAEEKAKKEAENQKSQDKWDKEKSEKNQEQEWIKTRLKDEGFVCTSLFFRDAKPRNVPEQRFATGSFSTGTAYYPKNYHGMHIWEEHYGNAIRTWIPSQFVDSYYHDEWKDLIALYKEERILAFRALSRIASGLSCFGDDKYEWAQQSIGEEKLVAMARSSGPITIESTGSDSGRDIASKYYRIAVKMKKSYTSEEYVVGYGDPKVSRGSRQTDEQWEKEKRLRGWVPLGEEDNPGHTWPTEEDIKGETEQSKKNNDFFDEIFG